MAEDVSVILADRMKACLSFSTLDCLTCLSFQREFRHCGNAGLWFYWCWQTNRSCVCQRSWTMLLTDRWEQKNTYSGLKTYLDTYAQLKISNWLIHCKNTFSRKSHKTYKWPKHHLIKCSNSIWVQMTWFNSWSMQFIWDSYILKCDLKCPNTVEVKNFKQCTVEL